MAICTTLVPGPAPVGIALGPHVGFVAGRSGLVGGPAWALRREVRLMCMGPLAVEAKVEFCCARGNDYLMMFGNRVYPVLLDENIIKKDRHADYHETTRRAQ